MQRISTPLGNTHVPMITTNTRPKPSLPKQRNHRIASSQEPTDIELANLPNPDTARAAIAIGLKLTEAKRWEEAETYFQKALELPGTGIKRFRDRPPTLSDGEKIAVMYNIACCQSSLGQPDNIENGLMAIAGVLEAGYDNFNQLQTDPDLANLRADPRFQGLLSRFQRKSQGGFGSFFSIQ